MSVETESGKGRIWVIDVARFYAIALVFYGHFIERFMLLKNPAGFAQYKFIYSFHMVVFLSWQAMWSRKVTSSFVSENI